MRFKALSLGLAAVLAVSCTDQPLTSPDTLSMSPNFDANPVVERATGSGHFDDFRFPDPEFRSFGFTALGRADGSTTGQWQVKNRNFPVHAHGVVECISLDVDGNEAWFAGTTTQSDDEELIDIIRAFRVVDKGQGSDADPDEVSFAFRVGDAQAWCNDQDPVPTNPIEEGNVQIR